MSLNNYLALVTSEHQPKPKFMAVLSALLQPLSDISSNTLALPGLFDIDTAAGQQLDYLGQWVGLTRVLKVPLTGVFFSLDTLGLGLDQGILIDPYTQTDGLEKLPDAQYRLILGMGITNNHWNGSIVDAYSILNTVFNSIAYYPFIQDNADMSMILGIAGSVDPVTQAMLSQGLLDIRPAGVSSSYLVPSVIGAFFGLDLETKYVSGLDVGSWAMNAPYVQAQA